MKLNPTTNCGCCSGGCSVPFKATGCGGLPLPGVTITVKTLGGATVASGVTDATGFVTLDIGTAGVYNVVGDTGTVRFNTVTNSSVSLFCGTQWNVGFSLAVASGYHCLPVTFGCAWPVKDTLQLTDSVYGSTTLAWSSTSGGIWSGTKTIFYPGYCGCAATNGPQIYYELNVNGFKSNVTTSGIGCCPAPAGSGCADAGITVGALGGGGGTYSIACWNPSGGVFTYIENHTMGSCSPVFSLTNLYGASAAVTWTFTE